MDYFSKKEKSCPCCGLNLVDQNQHFLQALNTARAIAGIPFKVTSMTRCQKHNAELKDSKPNSAHTKGLAVDIVCNASTTRMKIHKALFVAGFKRIGIAKGFIHADMDETLPQEVEWLY